MTAAQGADPGLEALGSCRPVAERELHDVVTKLHRPVDVGAGVERRVEVEHRRQVSGRAPQVESPDESGRRHTGDARELLGHDGPGGGIVPALGDRRTEGQHEQVALEGHLVDQCTQDRSGELGDTQVGIEGRV